MKKLTTLVLIVLLFASSAHAQLRFGIKCGANASSLSTTSSVIDQVKAATSYQAGVLMQLKLGGFAIQPELLYSIKGGDLRNANLSPQLAALTQNADEIKYKTQNIDIPVNFQFGKSFGPARIYAQIGPYVSFQLGAALNGDVKLYDTVDETFEFNKYDWGVGLGVGAELLGFQFSFKYDFGMNEVGKETGISDINVNPFNEMKNRNLNVSLAYLF
ncbi:MAG: porin family protein [Bacteroidales bacterium]|nr:porin family protein [Bacteroidales bacterium]